MTDPTCRSLGAANGPDVAGRLVSVAPIHSKNGLLAHIPLVGEPEDEPKADQNGGDKAEGRNGEDGQPLLAHAAER